jgi:hypothetical protein
VPTGKPTFPLTTTSFSSSAGKRVPGASIEEMPCSVRTTSGVPAGIVTPNAVSTARKARLAIPIQIKVCLFIYPNMRHDVALVYWTLVVPTKEASIEVALLCCLLHLASIKIVVTFDYADLGCEFAELGLLWTLRCADSRTAPEIVFGHGLLDSSCAANRDAGTYIATSRAMRMAT